MRVAAWVRMTVFACVAMPPFLWAPCAWALDDSESPAFASTGAAENEGAPSLADAGSGSLQPVGDRWAWNRGTYRHFVAALGLGRRLPRVGVESSRTYTDAFAGMTWGAPNGAQHGIGLDASLGATGPLEVAVTPSYLFVWRLDAALMGTARVGIPVSVDDWTYGFEFALGAAGLGTTAFGLSVEAVATLYEQPVGREDESFSALCLEVGVWFDQEQLP